MNTDLTIPSAALERLRAKAAVAAEIETWKPAPGDVLEGVIAGSRRVDGPFGEQAQAVIRTPDGRTVSVWLSAWLLGQLRANGAELGDLISLTFHGRETGRRGQAFNRLSLVVLKP